MERERGMYIGGKRARTSDAHITRHNTDSNPFSALPHFTFLLCTLKKVTRVPGIVMVVHHACTVLTVHTTHVHK
jgi:hypothetical protein